MIVETQNQESNIAAIEDNQAFVAMQDLELMYVGGGGAGAVLF